MTDADPEVIAEINELVESRFQLEVEREAENRRFQAAMADLSREHQDKLNEFAERERELDPAIWRLLNDNRPTLIARGKRSFVTMRAKFQFREVPARLEVLDKVGIMEAAHRLGVVKQIANPPKGGWKFNQKKFHAWLTSSGDLCRHFEAFVDQTAKTESLTVQPNATYTVEYDSQRISPPSITIQKS